MFRPFLKGQISLLTGKILRAYAYLKTHGIEVKLDLQKLPKSKPLGKWVGKGAKIAADQIIFSSLYTLTFFVVVGMLNGAADMMELSYLLYQQQHQQIEHLSKKADEVLPVHYTWWRRILFAYPVQPEGQKKIENSNIGSATDSTTAVSRKEFENRYTALLAKYGKVPFIYAESLPDSKASVSLSCWRNILIY